MIQKIYLSKKTNRILISIWLITIIFIAIYLTNIWVNTKKQVDEFISKQVNSKIYNLKDLNRGSYLVRLKVSDSVQEIALNIAYDIKKNNIIIGDSFTKNRNSDTIIVYRTEKAESLKIAEFQF